MNYLLMCVAQLPLNKLIQSCPFSVIASIICEVLKSSVRLQPWVPKEQAMSTQTGHRQKQVRVLDHSALPVKMVKRCWQPPLWSTSEDQGTH